MIIEDRVHESEAPSAEPAEEIMLAALFANSEIPPLLLESIPKGVGVRRRISLEKGRRRVVRWRL